jgi:hypothetical protein
MDLFGVEFGQKVHLKLREYPIETLMTGFNLSFISTEAAVPVRLPLAQAAVLLY